MDKVETMLKLTQGNEVLFLFSSLPFSDLEELCFV